MFTWNREIKRFEYARSNSGTNRRKGRLHKAIRHNFGEAPWASGSFGDIVVNEEYFYTGPVARLRFATAVLCPASLSWTLARVP